MPPFEFFVIKYANQWELKEKPLHESLSGKSIPDEMISKSLQHFKVGRTFKGLGDKGSKTFIAKALIEVSKCTTINNYPDRVNSLAKLLAKKFGTHNISAASKLLWLRKRYPVLIIDKWAKKSLMDRGLPRTADYEQYSQAWRAEFKSNEKAIQNACKKLKGAKEFSAFWEKIDREVIEIANASWFQERVFDMHLLYLGKNS